MGSALARGNFGSAKGFLKIVMKLKDEIKRKKETTITKNK
jgi:hypothetical protein